MGSRFPGAGCKMARGGANDRHGEKSNQSAVSGNPFTQRRWNIDGQHLQIVPLLSRGKHLQSRKGKTTRKLNSDGSACFSRRAAANDVKAGVRRESKDPSIYGALSP